MTSRAVKAIAFYTAGIVLAVSGAIGTIAGILANATAPECSVLNGDACLVQREIVGTAATGYIVGGIVLLGIGLMLVWAATPWLREIDEAEKHPEPADD